MTSFLGPAVFFVSLCYMKLSFFLDCRFISLFMFCFAFFFSQDIKVVSAICTTEYGEESNLEVTESNLNEYRCVCKGVTPGKLASDVKCVLYYLACPIQAP